jgi:hypothetical protein
MMGYSQHGFSYSAEMYYPFLLEFITEHNYSALKNKDTRCGGT